MSIIKNNIPILEYDDAQLAVIMPRKGVCNLPEHAVFPFLSDEIEKFAEKFGCKKVTEFLSATKTYHIYTTIYNGIQVCLCQAPVGAAAATQLLDFLISCGVRYIISAGTCGALVELGENHFLIPVEALRCEGTSYHYLPPSRTVKMNTIAINAIQSALSDNNIPFSTCKTWTTDGFFRETKDLVEYRRLEGYSVVEMECSALIACAEFRNVVLGMILFTADTLVDVENHNARNWGHDSFPTALKLSLDAVIKL